MLASIHSIGGMPVIVLFGVCVTLARWSVRRAMAKSSTTDVGHRHDRSH